MLLTILFAVVMVSCLLLTARRRKAAALAPLCAASALYLLLAIIAKVAFEGFAPDGGTLAEVGAIAVHGLVAVGVFFLAARWLRADTVAGQLRRAKPPA